MFQFYCSNLKPISSGKILIFLQFMLFSSIRLDMSEKRRSTEQATSSASTKKEKKYFAQSKTEYEKTYDFV